MLSVFTLKKMSCPKCFSKSRLKCAKSPLPVDVNRLKTSLLKVLLKNNDRKWNLFTSHEATSSLGRFPLALQVGRPHSKARGKRPGDKVVHESNFQHHFSFFILCAAPSSKLRAGVTRDGPIISMKPKGPKVTSSGLLPRL